MSEALGCKNPLSDYSIGSDLYDKPNHDWIVMGSYGENALYQKDKITLVDNAGRLSVRTPNYKPLPDSELPRATLVPMLELMRKYFQHQ